MIQTTSAAEKMRQIQIGDIVTYTTSEGERRSGKVAGWFRRIPEHGRQIDYCVLHDDAQVALSCIVSRCRRGQAELTF